MNVKPHNIIRNRYCSSNLDEKIKEDFICKMRNDEQNHIGFYDIKKDFMNKTNSEKGGKFLSQHKTVDSVYLR